MKQNYLSLLAAGLLLGSLPTALKAQEVLTVARGSQQSLTAPTGHKTYQWQVSTDNVVYVDMPEQTAQTLQLKVAAPAYYRVIAHDSEGKVSTLPVAHLQLTPLKNMRFTTYLSAAQGYAIMGDQHGAMWAINVPADDRNDFMVGLNKKLTKWNETAARAEYYFHHPRILSTSSAGLDGYLLLTANKGKTVQLRLRVINPATESIMADNLISFQGKGREDTIPVVALPGINKAGYYKYELSAIAGNRDINNISRWEFRSTFATKSFVAAYLSSPSVHLNNWRSTAPGASTENSDWCYQEVMIPKESDVVGTYAMSLGVLKGYMGIQVNGDGRHDIIFSMWDDGSVDENKDLEIYKRASAVDASSIVRVNRFGNEGTGIQTITNGRHWECDKYVQFITNVRPEHKTFTEKLADGTTKTIQLENALVSAWFNAQDGKGWQYLATCRVPGGGHYFNSWYSFLENYNWPSGDVKRKAYFRNGYNRNRISKEWFYCNSVGFGHTDGQGKVGSRDDYEQGQDPQNENQFYMTTGGYTPTRQTSTTIPLTTDNTPIDTINIETLLARVDLAIEHENQRIAAQKQLEDATYEKKGWRIKSFSSQETSGEGEVNGRAACIIDDNPETFWHSSWQSGGTAQFPHNIVIDMQKELPVGGMQFKLSGGENRYPKHIRIYGSTNGVTFKKVYENENCPNKEEYYLSFGSANTMRYLKIEILNGFNNEPFTRINEVYVMAPNDNPTTGITSSKETFNERLVNVLPGGTLAVIAPVTAPDMYIEVIGMGGQILRTQHSYGLVQGEITRLQVKTPDALALIRVTTGGKTYVQRIALR